MSHASIRPDLYKSADVETDGPVPGIYSLLSFGLSIVGKYDGGEFDRWTQRDHTFYRELRPISEEFQAEALESPVAFDWAFLYWYFERYVPDGSPFGHSSCLDIRTLYQAVAGTVFDRSGKTAMPEFLQPSAPHTHNALDDAVEQGELFSNLLGWAMKRRDAIGQQLEPPSGGPSWLAPHIAPIA